MTIEEIHSELNIGHSRFEPYVPFTKTSFLQNRFVEKIGRVKAAKQVALVALCTKLHLVQTFFYIKSH